jgi:uncharacterized protein YndB with AHSA1/START domain
MSDRIEKSVVLPVTRARLWRAISDAAEFGAWFGVKLAGPFVPGTTVKGQITITGYTHVDFSVVVETVESERRLAFRWHPYAVEPNVDYSKEPMTLVTMTLEDAPEGTKLVIVESGFDRIPAARRAMAFKMNDGGWTGQVKNVAKWVAEHPD